MAEEQQDGQKTVVAFVVGLLIGGMLVWAFSGPEADAPSDKLTGDDNEVTVATSPDEDVEDTKDNLMTKEDGKENVVPKAELQVGDGSVNVEDQKAGLTVALDSATYPVSEGWIGVRQYNNENLGYILGVVRFSESQGLIPSEIILQQPTTPGREYAVVIFTEDGNFDFNLSGDVQIDTIFDTFKAQ